MKEKLDRFLKNRNQGSLFLWIVAGGYLVYLAYSIFTGDMGGADHAVLYAFCALFLLAGLLLCGVALYAFFGKHYDLPGEKEDEQKK